jgi:chromosome segregation ATPase
MSAKAQVSDDLIHTMSKKIAQLTKVIYLLNTKSDEHDYETKCIRESHENDVKDVLEDAHSKMVKFQRDLISSSDAQDVKAREIIQQLERKNAEEKKNALEQLRQVKQKASDNERILKEASQNEIAGIRKEVEDVKAEFHKRLEAFSKLQKTIEANASSGSEALKKAHADEIAELVRKSNAKYNQMFNERMEAEEDLKEQLEALRAQLKESAAAEKVKKEYEAKIAKQAAELDQKMKDALRAQKEKFDEAMAERHHDAKTMNKLQAELDSVRTQLAASKEELKNSRSNFDAKEKELKAAAEEANNSKMLMVKQIQRMEVSIQGLRAEIEHLTSQLEQRDNAASKLGGDLASQQKEREAQAALLADARRQLEESKKRCEALESELDELKKQHAANVEKNKATAKKLAEREADVKRLTDDNKRLRDAASQDSAAKDAASQELAKQLDEIQKKYKKVGAKAKEYKALNETQKTELEMLKEACANHERAAEVSVGDLAKARSEADALRVELRRIKEQLEAREVELKNLSSSLQLEGANGREAQQAASRALADAEARCAELTRQLKAANEKAVKDARTLEQV